MTMGPAPMMRMLLMSVRFGMVSQLSSLLAASLVGVHQFQEVVKDRRNVLWPRAGLGMPLETEGGFVGQFQALQRSVEQGQVRDPDIGRQTGGIASEAVVLAGDEDLAGGEVLHRVIGAMMAELHL